jgi:hypothetical protein
MPGSGGFMKYRAARERMPLWVKVALAILGIGVIAYVSGAVMVDQMLGVKAG